MDGSKITEVILGILAPVIVLAFAFNYAARDVVNTYDPELGRSLGAAKNEPAIAIGVATIGLGVAIALFSWFWLSNQPSTENIWQIGMVVSFVVGGLGLLVLAGFLLLVICFGPNVVPL